MDDPYIGQTIILDGHSRVCTGYDPETQESVWEVAPTEWQPIESAPRDGTPLILARYGWLTDDSGVKQGTPAWCVLMLAPDSPRKYELWWVAKAFWSGKWENWNDGFEPCGLADPTHWMAIQPLEPPK